MGESLAVTSLSLWPALFHVGNKASLSVMEAWAPEDDISCGESSLRAAAPEDLAPGSARKPHWPGGEGACPGHRRGTREEQVGTCGSGQFQELLTMLGSALQGVLCLHQGWRGGGVRADVWTRWFLTVPRGHGRQDCGAGCGGGHQQEGEAKEEACPPAP